MRNRWLRAAAWGIGAAAVVAGCTDGAPTPPEGWTTAQVERLDLHVPDGWTETDPIDEWGHVWQQEVDGQVVGQLAVATGLVNEGSSAELLGSSLLEGMKMVRGSEMEVRDVVPDPMERDADFYRVRYTYDGGGQDFHGVIWTLGREGSQPVAVRLTTATQDDDLVEQLEAGLQFRP